MCKAFLEIGKRYGLVAGDIKSTSMGVSGVDVQFSPQAQRALGDIAVECKNVEALSVATTFSEHAAKYPGFLALLFHTRNRTEPMVTLRMKDFMQILAGWLANPEAKDITE